MRGARGRMWNDIEENTETDVYVMLRNIIYIFLNRPFAIKIIYGISFVHFVLRSEAYGYKLS